MLTLVLLTLTIIVIIVCMFMKPTENILNSNPKLRYLRVMCHYPEIYIKLHNSKATTIPYLSELLSFFLYLYVLNKKY